jgi:hypothetical protein
VETADVLAGSDEQRRRVLRPQSKPLQCTRSREGHQAVEFPRERCGFFIKAGDTSGTAPQGDIRGSVIARVKLALRDSW